MANVDVKRLDGTGAGSVELVESVFGIQPNVPVMHQVVTAQLAARRSGTQSTKTRAEVRGGGAKPWKQKGTGRARQGSTRSPQWSGGGVALGPKPRKYDQKTPKKMVQLALRSALSDRAAEGKIAVVDNWTFEKPSTKAAKAVIDALGVTGKVLLVLDREDEVAWRSFRNLTSVQILLNTELNAYDILCNDWIVFSQGTLPTRIGSNRAGAVEAEVNAARADSAGDVQTSAPVAAPETTEDVTPETTEDVE
jgi:large subunit ribosomal protein L4